MKHVQGRNFLYIKRAEVEVITISDDEPSGKCKAKAKNTRPSAKAAGKPAAGSAPETGARADERPEIVGAPFVALSLTTKSRKVTLPEINYVIPQVTEQVLRVMQGIYGGDDVDDHKPFITSILEVELKLCSVHLTPAQTIGTEGLVHLDEWKPYFVVRTPEPSVYHNYKGSNAFKNPGMDFLCYCAQIAFKARGAKCKEFDKNGWLTRIKDLFSK
jgi:hypothetical protein